MTTKIELKGLSDDSIRTGFEYPDGNIDRTLFERRIWWWRTAEKIDAGENIDTQKDFPGIEQSQLSIKSRYEKLEREIFMYELMARYTGKYQSGAPWFRLGWLSQAKILGEKFKNADEPPISFNAPHQKETDKAPYTRSIDIRINLGKGDREITVALGEYLETLRLQYDSPAAYSNEGKANAKVSWAIIEEVDLHARFRDIVTDRVKYAKGLIKGI